MNSPPRSGQKPCKSGKASATRCPQPVALVVQQYSTTAQLDFAVGSNIHLTALVRLVLETDKWNSNVLQLALGDIRTKFLPMNNAIKRGIVSHVNNVRRHWSATVRVSSAVNFSKGWTVSIALDIQSVASRYTKLTYFAKKQLWPTLFSQFRW